MRTRAPPRGANLRLLRSHPLPFTDRLSTLARQPTKHDSIGEKRKILSSGNAGEDRAETVEWRDPTRQRSCTWWAYIDITLAGRQVGR